MQIKGSVYVGFSFRVLGLGFHCTAPMQQALNPNPKPQTPIRVKGFRDYRVRLGPFEG